MLAGRLEETEADLEAHLGPQERFDREPRDPAVEARMRPLLQSALAGAPDGVTWALECHGPICRVEVTQPETSRFDWMKRLNGEPLRGLIDATRFQVGIPGRDPAGAPIITSESFLLLADRQD